MAVKDIFRKVLILPVCPACGVVLPCCGFPIIALTLLHGREAARGHYILIAIIFST